MDEQSTAPSGGPATISLNFCRPWTIIQPRIYRFMPAQFVDQFFDDGTLMLSSFNRFAQHEDEQRRDQHEGTGVRTLTGRDFTVIMTSGRGSDCYVLCGSTANTKAIRACFPDSDSCLVIDDPVQFASAVSFSVPGFRGGTAGPCIYQDEPVIRRHLEMLQAADVAPKTLGDLPDLSRVMGGLEELFVKLARYADQAEYRMLWGSSAPMEDKLLIKCPEARAFCRRQLCSNS